MSIRKRRWDRSGRSPLRSPGTPAVAGRDERRRFWAAIAAGLASEAAAVEAGASPAVGTRWSVRQATWHPDGFWYFVDLRRNHLHRRTPGKEPELVRTTIGGNGTTFDLQGRLMVCEADDRRLTRMAADGKVESLVDNYKGGRFNRPNDVICHSNGCLYFTDPEKRRSYHEREIPGPAGDNNLWEAPVSIGWRRTTASPCWRIANIRTGWRCTGRAHDVRREYPFVAIYPRDRARCGRQHGRAQHLRRPQGAEPGIPDGLKVDSIGRVCGRHPGHGPGLQAHRHHPVAGTGGQFNAGALSWF